MLFFKTLLVSASALVSLAAAQSNALFFTSVPTAIQAGETYEITYEATDPNAPVAITLRQGSSTDLNTVTTLTSSATGGTFSWTVPDSFPDGGDYALQITQGDENNYSGQFAITGGDPAAISSVSSRTATVSVSRSTITSSISSASSSLASAAITSSIGRNTTLSSATLTRSTTTFSNTGETGASETGETSSGPSGAPTDAATGLTQPLVFVAGAAVAALFL